MSDPCEDCTTRMQQAVHDLHTQMHPDGGRGCAECREVVLIVSRALADTGHVAPPADAVELTRVETGPNSMAARLRRGDVALEASYEVHRTLRKRFDEVWAERNELAAALDRLLDNRPSGAWGEEWDRARELRARSDDDG